MRDYLKYLILLLYLITAVVLIPLEMKLLGFILLGVTIIIVCFCEMHFRRDMLLIALALGILGATPINTDISTSHMLIIIIMLFLAVALPYFIAHRWYKEDTIRFPFHHGRSWYRSEVLYIVATAVLAYFVFPFYMQNTGSYHNWTVSLDPASLGKLFFATNAMGGWDEFFFISTILALFNKYFPFKLANVSQAVIFTSFLFELGFRGWAPLFIYPFALIQGYIFKKTHSLLYVVTIHLVLDFILYLVLIHSHYPNVLDIFIT